MIAALIALAVVLSIPALWLGYVIGIQHERGGPWRVLVLVAIPAALLDIVLNYTLLALITWDFPRPGEYTFSKRLNRLIDQSDWRGSMAFWIALYLLDPYDPDGFHVRR